MGFLASRLSRAGSWEAWGPQLLARGLMPSVCPSWGPPTLPAGLQMTGCEATRDPSA